MREDSPSYSTGQFASHFEREHINQPLPVYSSGLRSCLQPFKQGTEKTDNPIYAIIATYVLAQIILFADNVNDIASLVTMSTLLVFGVINLACFALRVWFSITLSHMTPS